MHPTDADQGEICFRGRNVMLGYLAPFDGSDAETTRLKNAEGFTHDGFFRSGDRGCRSHTGMFRITGRFAELIKTAGGEFVSPVPIEAAVVQRAPAVSKVVLIGDKRPFIVALVTLPHEGASFQRPGKRRLIGMALHLSAASSTVEQAMDDPVWRAYLAAAFNAVNHDETVCRTAVCRVQKFTILPTNFSMQGGELTPAMKVKRAYIAKKFERNIADLYAAEDAGRPTTREGSVQYVRWKEHAA